MSSDLISTDQGHSSLVHVQARPVDVPPAQGIVQRRSFARTLGVWLGLLKDYTAEDINRLKEAGVSKVEGHAKDINADAARKIAEAAKLHAEADLISAHKAKTAADAYAVTRKADADYALSVADAIQKVADAMNNLRQKGGNTGFDEKQLIQLLLNAKREFPTDPQIENASQEHLDSGDQEKA